MSETSATTSLYETKNKQTSSKASKSIAEAMLTSQMTNCVCNLDSVFDHSKEAKHFNAEQNQRITKDPTDRNRVRKRHIAVFHGISHQICYLKNDT